MEIITVAPGDTVFGIASRYGLSPDKIISDNGLPADGALVVGQALVLLFPDETYSSDFYESVSSVANSQYTTARTIFQNNYFLAGRSRLLPNEEIVINYDSYPIVSGILGGYAYSVIPDNLIYSVISYLTYLMPFTYGFTPEGELLSPDDARLIDIANSYGAKPLMHLSTLTESGVFSNELAHSLLINPDAIENIYQNILDTVIQKGYYGVDVDFEFLFAEDREAYVNFISGLTQLLNSNGFITVVALPPKTSDDQRGLLYEGIDYAGLGEAANYSFLMTYEWGYRFGEPQAVAPINAVRRVVEYALTRIPNNKILLGISNYGYDWALPFVMGQTEALSLSTVRALDLARQYGAEIQFDQVAESPYFNYNDSAGRSHIVWFEDARSYMGKVNLIREFRLAGGFIWDLMRENPQGFVTLNSLIDIE